MLLVQSIYYASRSTICLSYTRFNAYETCLIIDTVIAYAMHLYEID